MVDQERIHVLAMDTQRKDAQELKRQLESLPGLDVAVSTAEETSTAHDLLGKGPVHLVFLAADFVPGNDVSVPLALVREGRPDLPVVVVAGPGHEAAALESMRHGACDYLIKGRFTPEVLSRCVRYGLERRELAHEVSRLTEKLRDLSMTDELTDLANRKRLALVLEEESARSARTQRPFSLLMIDVDRLREVNERHGRSQGDRLLRRYADVLQRGVRRMDFIARYAGEEFCVVLREANRGQACVVADRLMELARGMSQPAATISIGVAEWEHKRTPDELIQQSIEALQRAKDEGCDRTAFIRG